MGETPSTCIPSFDASVVIEAHPERLTSDAGAVTVREAAERVPSAATSPRRLFPPSKPTGRRRFVSGRTSSANDCR